MSYLLPPLLRYAPRRASEWPRVGERYTDATEHPAGGPASPACAPPSIDHSLGSLPGSRYSGAHSQWNFGI